MPTKRTKVNRNPKHRISAAAVAAFRSGDHCTLADELRLPPWSPSPLDTDTDTPPEHSIGTAYAQAWPSAYALRHELEAAA